MRTISCLQNGIRWWKGLIPVSPIHCPFQTHFLQMPSQLYWLKMETWSLASFLIASPYQRSSTIHSCYCNYTRTCITSTLLSSLILPVLSSTQSNWALLCYLSQSATSMDSPFWSGCSLPLATPSHRDRSSLSTQTSLSIPSYLKCPIDCTPSSMDQMWNRFFPFIPSTCSLPTYTTQWMYPSWTFLLCLAMSLPLISQRTG